MLKKTTEHIQSSLNNLIIVCDDRLADLKEEMLLASDEWLVKDYQERIKHYTLLKDDAQKSLTELTNIVSDIPVSDIQNVVNYLYEDEEKDAKRQQEENGDYEGHIFSSIEEVDNWLNYIQTGNAKVL